MDRKDDPRAASDRMAPTAAGNLADATQEPAYLDTELSLSSTAKPKALEEATRVAQSMVDELQVRQAEGVLAKSERFEDQGPIASGGMGAVHLVNDKVLSRKVAMKSLHPRLAERREHIHRFLQEVQIAGSLDHPHIVPVHDVGLHEEGNVFFIMKHVDGETLSERIARTRDQPLAGQVLAEFLRIFLKLTDAIRFCHSRNVIHRDLKPSNIMVGNHGEVYVMDWGIASRAGIWEEESDTDPELNPIMSGPTEFEGALLGTVGYMAPEQADGRLADVDVRTDVFGLGAILYEILTGQALYGVSGDRSQLKRARAADIVDPMVAAGGRHLPPGLCRITMKALAKNPDDRYQSVEEFEAAVDAFLRGGGWFETRTVSAGTVIVAQDDAADAAYVIESGTCEVYKDAGGQRTLLRVMGPGEVFGETAIFTGKRRTATVVAVEETSLVVITRASLDYELGGGWLAVFVRALAERFCELDRRLGDS